MLLLKTLLGQYVWTLLYSQCRIFQTSCSIRQKTQPSCEIHIYMKKGGNDALIIYLLQ